MENNAIITRDNLIRRRWNGTPKHVFCDENGSIDHLFFSCPVAKVVWGIFASCMDADNIPRNLMQAWMRATRWIPNNKESMY